MGETSGIGEEGAPIEPSKAGGPEALSGGEGKALEKALHTPVSTLGQLKKVLVDNLGEEKGTKLYNTFLRSFAMMMLSQIQHSAEQAKKAAQQMRMNSQG